MLKEGGGNGRGESALAISVPNTQQCPVSGVSKQPGSPETEGNSNNSNRPKSSGAQTILWRSCSSPIAGCLTQLSVVLTFISVFFFPAHQPRRQLEIASLV